MTETKQKLIPQAKNILRKIFETIKLYPNKIDNTSAPEKIEVLIDEYLLYNYGADMNKIEKAASFDFLTTKIAFRYSVDPSDITDEFLSEKIKEDEEEAERYFQEYEERFGIKLGKDTPKTRRKLKADVKRLIESYPG